MHARICHLTWLQTHCSASDSIHGLLHFGVVVGRVGLALAFVAQVHSERRSYRQWECVKCVQYGIITIHLFSVAMTGALCHAEKNVMLILLVLFAVSASSAIFCFREVICPVSFA